MSTGSLDRFQVIHANLIRLIEDEGMFATQSWAKLDTESKTEVLHAVGKLFLKRICNLNKVKAMVSSTRRSLILCLLT